MELHKVSLGEYKVICKLQNTYLLFTGREVRLEKKTVHEVLNNAFSQR